MPQLVTRCLVLLIHAVFYVRCEFMYAYNSLASFDWHGNNWLVGCTQMMRCASIFFVADAWAAATKNGGDWVEFQFADDTGELSVCVFMTSLLALYAHETCIYYKQKI